jgi:hypothetical protein
MPSFPFGKPPFRLINSRYSIGQSHRSLPLNLPKGIFTVTICFNISGLGDTKQRLDFFSKVFDY